MRCGHSSTESQHSAAFVKPSKRLSQSVWATVTFMWADFQMPDGRGSALDVLNRAAARGLDVRLIFWRPDAETEKFKANAFWGSPEHIDLLDRSDSAIRVRWDRAQPGFCQHQKSWLIDSGTETETVFLGGINLNPHSMVAPGHRGEGQNHDVYMELAGPSAVDVHHNFVQRWNEASERHSPDGRWGSGSEIDLPFPTRLPSRRGDALVQIQRTIHSGRYRDGRATPEGAPFDIAAGERSNFDQYCAAINSARRSIYIENQHIEVPEIIDCLRQALLRGVEVVAVVPAEEKSQRNWRPWELSKTSRWPASLDWGTTDSASPFGFMPNSWSSMVNGGQLARATSIAIRSSAIPR